MHLLLHERLPNQTGHNKYLNYKMSCKDVAIFGEYKKHSVTERRRKEELKTAQPKCCTRDELHLQQQSHRTATSKTSQLAKQKRDKQIHPNVAAEEMGKHSCEQISTTGTPAQQGVSNRAVESAPALGAGSGGNTAGLTEP